MPVFLILVALSIGARAAELGHDFPFAIVAALAFIGALFIA